MRCFLTPIQKQRFILTPRTIYFLHVSSFGDSNFQMKGSFRVSGKFWEKYLIKYWIGGKDKKKERNVLSLNAVLYRQWTDGFKVFALFCARDRMGNGGRVLEERQVALLDQTAPGELWGVDTPHLPTQCSSGSSDLPCLMLLRWPSKQRWREGAGGGGEYRERCWQKHLWLWTSRGLLLWKQTATSSAGKVCCQRPPLPRSRST